MGNCGIQPTNRLYDNTSFEPNAIHSSGAFSKDIFSELSDLDQDQAFIDYLDELDGPISIDELAECRDMGSEKQKFLPITRNYCCCRSRDYH